MVAINDDVHNSSVYKQSQASGLLEMDPTVCPTTTTTTTTTLHHYLQKFQEPASKSLAHNIYVDNIQNTFQMESELLKFHTRSVQTMQDAGFNLSQWHSNSQMINNRINFMSKIDEKPVNVLDLDWDKGLDVICIRPLQQSIVSYITKVTKRSVVSEIARVFDPFGVILSQYEENY